MDNTRWIALLHQDIVSVLKHRNMAQIGIHGTEILSIMTQKNGSDVFYIVSLRSRYYSLTEAAADKQSKHLMCNGF